MKWAARLVALALLSLLGPLRAAKVGGGASTKSFRLGGVDESCLQLPKKELDVCATYQLPDDNIQEGLDMLCVPGHTNKFGRPTSLPFLSGCELARACGVLSGSPLPAVCSAFQVLASICGERPDLAGCANYRRMCTSGTAVNACKEEPFRGFGYLHTQQALLSVRRICAFKDKAPSLKPICARCNMKRDSPEDLPKMAKKCPNIVHTLASLCALPTEAVEGVVPSDEACFGWRQFCAANKALFPAFCNTEALALGRSKIGGDLYPRLEG